MPKATILYGEIIDPEGRRRLETNHPDHLERIVWKDKPLLFSAQDEPSLVFVDLDNTVFSNPEFLMSVATGGEKVRVIGKSSHPTMEDAVRVSKFGVSEILTPEDCLRRLDDFLKSLEPQPVPAGGTDPKYGVNALVGCSPQIREIRKTVMLLADVDFPSALILGETGTGKGLISKILHNTGLRAHHNMVEVNCSAIPDELFESELFGHMKGSFTDARADKVGLFEYAQNGTLFLDEVGNLSASAQAKLLKILEDKKLRKVGGVDEKDINVRVVAATNLDLKEAIGSGKFREDLYFRLNLLTIDIPPLRDRPEDIPEMVKHYLHFYSTIYRKQNLVISDEALDQMKRHHWRGNVRELCNVIERAVLLCKRSPIRPQDIKLALKKSRITAADRRQITIEVPSYGVSLEEIEGRIVKEVLDMCNWNKTETAKFLSISRPRLRRIIESAGLERNRRQS